jgi:thiosulfate/3-mercaptopyruvate sulfurtransferase
VTLTRRSLLSLLSITFVVACERAPAGGSTGSEPPEPLGPMLAPAELAKRIDDVKAGKVLVLYVGPELLYAQGRVPGARQLPETGTAAGREALTRTIRETPQETEIVVYCGCCPYGPCQNVRPASEILRASGRTNAKYLDLPTNFKTDWANKGYPVERG